MLRVRDRAFAREAHTNESSNGHLCAFRIQWVLWNTTDEWFETCMWHRRYGPVVKSTSCSSRGPTLASQAPVTPAPRHPVDLFWISRVLAPMYTSCTTPTPNHTHMEKTWSRHILMVCSLKHSLKQCDINARMAAFFNSFTIALEFLSSRETQ